MARWASSGMTLGRPRRGRFRHGLHSPTCRISLPFSPVPQFVTRLELTSSHAELIVPSGTVKRVLYVRTSSAPRLDKKRARDWCFWTLHHGGRSARRLWRARSRGIGRVTRAPPRSASSRCTRNRWRSRPNCRAGRSASLTAEVRPQVSGIIKTRLFKEGSEVKAGDPLYQIDPASYQAAYDSALAAEQKAEAAVPSAQAKVERYQGLIKQNAVSKQDLDDAIAALAAGQGGRRRGEGQRGDGADQSQLHQDHRADRGTHRQVVVDAGCPGDRQPDHGAHHHPHDRSHQCRCHRVGHQSLELASGDPGRAAEIQRSRRAREIEAR